ncbi:MAG: hypothetical protein WKF96_14810 [Solirubrobacteraceae bacterium]
MSKDNRDKLLRRDWSESWAQLPDAPPLVPGPKTAQITLRLSPGLLERLQRVAETGSLGYHPLARSWLIHAVQEDQAPPGEADEGPHTAQLNIKLDAQTVDALKARADQVRRPYHRLAREWIAAAVAREEQRLGLDAPPDPPSRQPVSPYSTGGGGVTFERRVAVLYLAMLLTGDTASELRDDREVRSVALQQAPHVPVDDLVVLAARPDEPEPSLELAVAVRRKPNIVGSDIDSQALIVEYLRALLRAPADGPERRLALAVAGAQPHAEQLAKLATLARNQMDAPLFFGLVKTPSKFDKQLRARLNHVQTLVRNALPELGIADADDSTVARRVWELLRRLVVLMPRVEEPDTKDWDATRSQLRAVARGGGVAAAGHLLSRLETLAAQYGPGAATVDRTLLRRDVHSLLDDTRPRSSGAWELLDELQRQARSAVRDHLGRGDAGDQLHLDRSSEGQAVMAAAQAVDALIVTGDSGVGKSALVFEAVAAAEAASKGEMQVVCLNLRQLPERSFDLAAQLGCPLDCVLSDLSAPSRYLVVDGADAAIEVRGLVFSALLRAARESGVRLIAISSTDARDVVKDLVTGELGDDRVDEHQLEDLSDPQLDQLTEKFPKLERLAAHPRSRELLRRLVVVDLLVRSELSGLPLTDADAMHQIWERLARNHGRRDRGLPDAREQAMMRLALRELSGGSASEAAAALDHAAVDGLRQDGLLRQSSDNPWQVVPDFAHDEIRRYAVARALLAEGDPAAALLDAGAPRWALSAGRLACQAILDQPDRNDAPVRGRFRRLQQTFDGLGAAGYGARWADLPSEALLTLGDARPMLTDAWPDLRSDDALGFERLLRLVGQRHRGADGTVDPVVVEPIIALLLEDTTPWWGSDQAVTALREWLLALVVRDAPDGDRLRVLLRDRLVAACAAAEEELVAEQRADAAARAARTPEQIEEERKHAERNRVLFETMGHGRRRRQERPAIPRALTDQTVLELLALLGPDLGADGEQLLRRVARDAPWQLAPAVEELGTGRAVASYGRGLLADLVEAYYLNADADADGSGFHEDGIRRHRSRGGFAPLSAWYRGPFGALFASDFRGGVSVLNRLLNHAAGARARTLSGLDDRWGQPSEDAVDAYSVELRITGAPRTYVGDDHVWRWYRGTGVGPYPCMSALQALERFCDQLLAAEIPPSWLVPILMERCANLAMPGLVVGVLVRHIEQAGTLLDPFLADPLVWRLEFVRTVSESGGLAASSEGLVEPERRTWSLREAATWLTLKSGRDRAETLRAVGDQLVARAVEIEQHARAESDRAAHHSEDPAAVSFSTTVRNWASTLDRDRYEAVSEGDVVYVQTTPPEDVQAALEPGNQDLQRGQEAMRLFWRYFGGGASRRRKAEPPPDEELADDLAAARELLEDPPVLSAIDLSDMAAIIAAHSLEALVVRGIALPAEAEQFAASTLLAVAENAKPRGEFEFEGSYFEQGADRSAARGLPLLLLPAAARLRATLSAGGGPGGDALVLAAGRRLAGAVADETRLHLARGLDAVWETACDSGESCHHQLGLELAIESMRDCAFGDWDDSGHRRVETLEHPVIEALAALGDDRVFVSRLDAAIRAAGAAAVRETCVRDEARELLLELVRAQRRGLLAHEHNFDERGSHALVAARALLGLAGAGDDAPLREHIAAYADNSSLLGSFLAAVAAAAEERPAAAEAARRLWPSVMTDVLELNSAGHNPFGDDHFGRVALASVIPAPTYETAFLYWEVGEEPIVWTDPVAWAAEIDAWLPVAAGEPHCVDSMIGLVRTLPADDQVTFGLPRIATLVMGNPEAIVRGSYLLTEWLKNVRSAAVDENALSVWQEVVDALVVAGNTALAPYSD